MCANRGGHVEAVQVVFVPARLTYEQLLEAFWTLHDPTSLHRQGEEEGPQYRPVVFVHDGRQREIAERVKRRAGESGRHQGPIVTEIAEFGCFWPAENEHQKTLSRRRHAEERGGRAG